MLMACDMFVNRYFFNTIIITHLHRSTIDLSEMEITQR